MTKSGVRIHIVDTPGIESISLATPRSNHLLMSEKVNETGRPAISLQTLGDIHFRAAGRIHQHAALHSQHIDGKIMHKVSITLTDWWGNMAPYQDVNLKAELSSGETHERVMASGQSFDALPPGANKFSFPNSR